MTEEQELMLTPEEWWKYSGHLKYVLDINIPKLIYEDGGVAMQIVSGTFSMLEGGEPYAAIHPDVEEEFIKQFSEVGIRAEKIMWEKGNAKLSL